MSAHSLSVAFPRSSAPASRNFATTYASRGTTDPKSIQLPAVVSILSFVAMLSLTRNGIPWSGPRTAPVARSASKAAAIVIKSGFSSMIALEHGQLSPSINVVVKIHGCRVARAFCEPTLYMNPSDIFSVDSRARFVQRSIVPCSWLPGADQWSPPPEQCHYRQAWETVGRRHPTHFPTVGTHKGTGRTNPGRWQCWNCSRSNLLLSCSHLEGLPIFHHRRRRKALRRHLALEDAFSMLEQ